MLYAALVLAGLLCLISNRAAVRSKQPILAVFFSGLGLTFLPICAHTVIPVVPLLTLIYCVLLLLPRSCFFPLSIISLVIVFGLLSIPALDNQREFAKRRERFPFESLEERLPLPTEPTSKSATGFDEAKWLALERDIALASSPGRTRQLQTLHDSTVSRFVNSPGFGLGRMNTRFFVEGAPTEGMRDERSIPQPFTPGGKTTSNDNPTPIPIISEGSLSQMHHASILDFLHPQGFGYFKDRQHVAGFQSHQFSKVPEPPAKLRVSSAELIGWLRGSPVAYVSENLPAMKELRKAPTRPLDPFEEEGLAYLRKGNDLFVKSGDGEERVLGAIRATKQCLDCHGGQRGDLLGAFSYVLR